MGKRITRMELHGKPIDAGRTYKVAGWASVAEESRTAGGEAIWDVCARYLRGQNVVKVKPPNVPVIEGMRGNPGMT
jgi:sulfur-oxidizing protein SoxB